MSDNKDLEICPMKFGKDNERCIGSDCAWWVEDYESIGACAVWEMGVNSLGSSKHREKHNNKTE